MMTHLDHRLAKALREEATHRADTGRQARVADDVMPAGAGVKDAIGHGLIALGSRLVADPAEHPRHRAA